MATKHCLAFGASITPWPQSKNQQFCSNPLCQRERRRRKQAERRFRSAAMRENDAQYFRDWSAKNPRYWKKYRAEHPAYAERNRTQQHERNQVRIAKDTLRPPNPLPSGLYQLFPATLEMVANETVWIVEITVLSGPKNADALNCK